MLETITFDDVLIVPKFSTVKSRRDVNLTSMGLKLPVISSNMDSVTESAMAKAMAEAGAVGCLHRFMDIDTNIKMFKDSLVRPWVSIGLGDKELERAIALVSSGAETVVIDVAHGANMEVVKQAKALRDVDRQLNIVVGNFGDVEEVTAFNYEFGYHPLTYKVGIGGGSACTTRIETGCGYPTLGALLSFRHRGFDIIADGGIRTPGDVAKAIAAGAKAVMLGGMLAGTTETPGNALVDSTGWIKKYRGSASQESYAAQKKDESWRTAEGRSFTVRFKGPVKDVLQRIEGGLRSAYSYVGANNTEEFQHKADFIKVSHAGLIESHPHGEKN